MTSYLHRSDRDLPPTLGVLVQLDKPSEEVARDLAQQIAAMRPMYTTRDEVPADVVEKERRIAEQITRDEGKPEQAIPRIVEGRVGAFFKDVVLTRAGVREGAEAVCRSGAQGRRRNGTCIRPLPSRPGLTHAALLRAKSARRRAG